MEIDKLFFQDQMNNYQSAEWIKAEETDGILVTKRKKNEQLFPSWQIFKPHSLLKLNIVLYIIYKITWKGWADYKYFEQIFWIILLISLYDSRELQEKFQQPKLYNNSNKYKRFKS